ncbi:MAG: DNA repair protein RecO [Rhodospirillales bacterium]|nr:DNA repair protein RecO [Rhodospirillales bacterium]
MEWSDEGIIIRVRKHGETSVIVGLLTRDHGRHVGLVRGGQSRRRQGQLQTGNLVSAVWRARLSDHLGSYTLESSRDFAALVLDDPIRLKALMSLGALLDTVLAERDPHPEMFQATVMVLGALTKTSDDKAALAVYVQWELELLRCLGFGLDLETCAATGGHEDLVYVSPRSGRAVSAAAGAPYHDKLLSLPAFLVEPGASISMEEIEKGLALTGAFLTQHHFAVEGRHQPAARGRFIEAMQAVCGK